MNRAGIVVVSYNSARYLAPCLEAALRASDNVVVVDNASADDSVAVIRTLPQPKLIANSTNKGFAAAVNQGIEALDAEFVVLLNPDAVMETSLEPLIQACSMPGTAAVGGKLIDEDGLLQTGFCVRRFPTPAALAFEALGLNRIWPSNPVNRRYRCGDLDLAVPQPVEQPAGAFLMIRRSVWEELGGFDERFFPIWFEEVDFLKRAAAQGCAIRYTPGAVARHKGGHSLAAVAKPALLGYWYDNLLRFSAKHFRPIAFRAVCAAVLAGVSARVVLGILSGSPAATGRSGIQILRLALNCLFRGPAVYGPAFLGRQPGYRSGGCSPDGETTTERKLFNSHSHGL
jgi:GT2 family glycosyltransferase